ncbi:hypothetical protein MPSEU_001038800 [Mayamaea pseudoterrestris]|nr:hypothetical protein MPSEU_001038800 [Mayamaea pseudoterrestris]
MTWMKYTTGCDRSSVSSCSSFSHPLGSWTIATACVLLGAVAVDYIGSSAIHRKIHTVCRHVFRRFTTAPQRVQMRDHLRLTLLCCHRTLQVDDVSRVIASFHKDLLRNNVLQRLETLRHDLLDEADDDEHSSSLHYCTSELVHYMTFYARDEQVYIVCLAMLVSVAKKTAGSHLTELFDATIDTIVKGGLLQPTMVNRRLFGQFLFYILEKEACTPTHVLDRYDPAIGLYRRIGARQLAIASWRLAEQNSCLDK